VFYLDTVRLENFSLEDVTVTDTRAELDGGMIFVGKMPGTINITDSTFSNFWVAETRTGSFLHSATENSLRILLSRNAFICNSTFN
jgi:hypothetical protein